MNSEVLRLNSALASLVGIPLSMVISAYTPTFEAYLAAGGEILSPEKRELKRRLLEEAEVHRQEQLKKKKALEIQRAEEQKREDILRTRAHARYEIIQNLIRADVKKLPREFAELNPENLDLHQITIRKLMDYDDINHVLCTVCCRGTSSTLRFESNGCGHIACNFCWSILLKCPFCKAPRSAQRTVVYA